MDALRTLTEEQVRSLQATFGTPLYAYDENTLEAQARRALDFPNPFGLTVRFAMKACPSAAVVRIFDRLGLHIDASSGFEARRAMLAGIAGDHILLTAQEVPADLEALVAEGVQFNACSLAQLATYGRLFPGGDVGVRFNPGLGSGHSNRTNVGGPSASFGIWHAHLKEVLAICDEFNLRVRLLHSHIGSGSDPVVWQRCARLTLGIIEHLPDVTTVNLGGGFKVGRMADETSTDLISAGEPVAVELEQFGRDSGRKLHLEIEPGTFLVALAGSVVCTATDIVTTGKEGYSFVKVDTGMTELMRPSLYGAQHPIVVVPPTAEPRGTGGVSRCRPLLREWRRPDAGTRQPGRLATAYAVGDENRRRAVYRRQRRLLLLHVGEELQFVSRSGRNPRRCRRDLPRDSSAPVS